ncbi:MAG: ATP-binding protein, partial [Thermomicrobiales bacterium]
LGQISAVQLKNPWHEDPTMRSLIRQRGRVDAVSERQDTHLAQMEVSAVFQETRAGYQPSILGTVPSTGTSIHVVSDAVLDALLAPYRDELFYLGHVFGSTPLLPMWFKHFGSGEGGAGEAYHLGIFGKTGSGKSVLAKMILLAYSRHPSMGILVIDPQGEFAQDMQTGSVPGAMKLPLRELIGNHGRETRVVRVRNLVLDRWELFTEILYESQFFEKLTVPKGDNRRNACTELEEYLQKKKVKLDELATDKGFQAMEDAFSDVTIQGRIYRATGARDRFVGALQASVDDGSLRSVWDQVAYLFSTSRRNAVKIDAVLHSLFEDVERARPVIVLDLSRESAGEANWTDKIADIVIKRLLDGLSLTAERHYAEGKSLNTLVIIDEAHRLAPRTDSSSTVKSVLVDAARTTRKYGLGWLFISQTLSSIDRDIVSQLRIFFCGFGLSMGQEWQSLKELAGGSSSLELYQSFRDPHSSFSVESRQYSFMCVGPVSPLSFYGRPLFFNAFNTVSEFVGSNLSKRRDRVINVAMPSQRPIDFNAP